MTRKRFIKLVMGYGISRNKATQFADSVSRYGTYQRTYESTVIQFARIAASVRRAVEAIVLFGTATKQVAGILSEAGKTIRQGMGEE